MNSKKLIIFGVVSFGVFLIPNEVIWAQQTFEKLPEIQVPKPATIGQPSLMSITGVPNSSLTPTPIRSEPLAVWQEEQVRIARQQAYMQELFRELPSTGRSYEFPNKDHLPGAQAYFEAYEELRAMLDGETPLDLMKAIFAVENAYFNNQGRFEDFDNKIKELAELTSAYITQQGWDQNNPMPPLLALHHLFADTLTIEQPGLEEAIVHYPITYDFEDYRGREDLSNLFVSKVLATGTGQCYSMPQLYLLLAQELGGEAWLSFSPNHSFIKFKDEYNQWYNLELTNGNVVSESWMMASGYMTIESIQNDIYLDTLSLKETIATKMVDLALGFGNKYGYDDFVLQAVNKGLEHHPENVPGMITKANYYTDLVWYVADQMNNPTNEEYVADPYARSILVMRERMYSLIDHSGYRPMPDEVYEEWLTSIEEYRAKQAEQSNTINSSRPQNKEP
jgi:hypothetical protein